MDEDMDVSYWEQDIGMKRGGLREIHVPPGDEMALQKAVEETAAHREQIAHADAMTAALSDCKGFGLFSMYLLHVSPRSGIAVTKDRRPSWTDNKVFSILSLATLMVIVCQWLAPASVGAYLYKHVKVERVVCPMEATLEEKLLMSAISAIYFSKLYARFYPRMTIRDHFWKNGLNVAWMIPSNTWIYDLGMPLHWREAYIADIVLMDTIYDTMVYLFNLSLIYVTISPLEMVLNTVAFEFFTTLDDEFKRVALERIVEGTYIQVYFAKLKGNANYWVEKAQDPEQRFKNVTSLWIILPAFITMYAGLILSFIGIFFGPICK